MRPIPVPPPPGWEGRARGRQEGEQAWAREPSLAPGVGCGARRMTIPHMCVGPGTFPRAFKCIILLEAHLRQGLRTSLENN